jgi:hypothetical protein
LKVTHSDQVSTVKAEFRDPVDQQALIQKGQNDPKGEKKILHDLGSSPKV